jgi:hypothetical protein
MISKPSEIFRKKQLALSLLTNLLKFGYADFTHLFFEDKHHDSESVLILYVQIKI